MSGNFRYRHFRQEFLSLAGFHTGEKLVIDEAYIDEETTALHELTHGRIFDETLDGKLHKCVMLCLRNNIHPAYNNVLTCVNDFLFEDTRLPHERTATFLGIIGLRERSDMVKAVAELNEEYSHYFAYFSDFLPWSNSSFLSFLIVQSIIRFTFNSERFSTLSDISTLTVAKLQSVKGPQQRMDLAKQVFIDGQFGGSHQIIQGIFEQIMRIHSIEPYDVYDDSAWTTRIKSGKTDTSIIERVGCGIFADFISTQSSCNVCYKIEIPKCFDSVANLVQDRGFNTEFPIIDGVRVLPEDAAHFYAREADRNLIDRRTFLEIPELPLSYFLDRLRNYIEQDLCIVFVQLDRQPEQFKMFASVTYENEINFTPGSGLVIDIDDMAQLAFKLGEIVIKRKIHSPPLYIIYSPGLPEGGMPIHIPEFKGIVKVFPDHLTVAEKPVSGQGLLIRPMVYGRSFWSHAINDILGEHRDYLVKMCNEDDGRSNEYRAQILIPVSGHGLPIISIMDHLSYSSYSSFLQHKVSQGRLKSKKPTDLDRGLSESFVAIWETLPFV